MVPSEHVCLPQRIRQNWAQNLQSQGFQSCLLLSVKKMGCSTGKEDMVGQPWARRAGPAFGYQQPMYDQCDQYAPARPLCQGPSYMQQPYGNGIGYQQPLPGYGDYAQPAVLPQQNAYASYGNVYDMQQRQETGSRMAMAAAGGLALGAGAVFAADHAGNIAHFAEEAVENMGDFARDIF